MKLAAQTEAKLRELIERGALPSSRCRRAFLKLISPLLASGAVAEQKSGAGRQLVVREAGVVRDFHQQRFPATELPPDTGSRIAGVGRYRDSKALANDTGQIVSLRVWRDDVVFRNGEPVDAPALTEAHGVFSFLLAPNCSYELRGPCALAENPALFAVAEKLLLPVAAVLHGNGCISNRALDWLARMPDPRFRLIHLPDYDPAGLTEFQRLQARLGERITLHIPDDLEQRFSRFANRDLLAKGNTRAMLAQLRRSNSTPILRVVELIDRHNAGLEHEALLL